MKRKFYIYKKEFVCDHCGELSFMGIIGFSERITNICDLCLVNELELEDIDHHQMLELDAKEIRFDPSQQGEEES